eukprot:3612873-Rhodomonas_salina.2
MLFPSSLVYSCCASQSLSESLCSLPASDRFHFGKDIRLKSFPFRERRPDCICRHCTDARWFHSTGNTVLLAGAVYWCKLHECTLPSLWPGNADIKPGDARPISCSSARRGRGETRLAINVVVGVHGQAHGIACIGPIIDAVHPLGRGNRSVD